MKTKLHIILILTLSLVCLILPQGLCLGATTNQISQFGITWTFDTEYEYGQFANGDYWVVGPVNIIGIDPASTVIDGRAVHGSMVNPSPVVYRQGYSTVYDSRFPQYYQEMNAAWGVSSSNPLTLSPHSSLVSTISMIPYVKWRCIKTAAVLTVLDKPAPEGSFRPPYSGTDKTIKFNKNQLDYSLLGKLPPVSNTPRLKQQPGDGQGASVERMFERPWIDHVPGWTGNHLHAVENSQTYGEYLSNQVGEGALMLHLDYTNEQKETLLIRFVQVGIDNYGIIQAGGIESWYGDGGCTHGRKWPILFAGLVLNDNDMKNIGEKSGDYFYHNGYDVRNHPPDYIHFSEDDQSYYVDDIDIERCIGYTHESPPPDLPQVTPYQRPNFEPFGWEDKGQPEHRKYPLINWETKAWQSEYRRTNTAMSWAGWLLAAIIMEEKAAAKTLWNHDIIFDYQDRYMKAEQEILDTAFWDPDYLYKAPDDYGAYFGYYRGEKCFIGKYVSSWHRQSSGFAAEMWDTYRANYPPIWTPGSNRPPVAVISANPTSGEAPLTVNFDGSLSSDPDGDIKKYEWDFENDGVVDAQGATASYTYTTEGNYMAKLTVTDDGGLTDTDTVTITVLKGDEEFGELPTGCYNNVFNPTKGEEALVVVELSKQARVRLYLYNAKGNKIRELADEEKEAGPHKYYWDGRNDSGNIVGCGLYFVHIQAGDYKKTKKIVVVK